MNWVPVSAVNPYKCSRPAQESVESVKNITNKFNKVLDKRDKSREYDAKARLMRVVNV
ncbi:Uncharacterised protein [Halioglobus japonicus]|nr:Uncharacterised protein [Halioglobus japonicus]